MKSLLDRGLLLSLGLSLVLAGCQKETPGVSKINDMLVVLGQVHDLLDGIDSSEDAEGALPGFQKHMESMIAINARPGSYDWDSTTSGRGGGVNATLEAYLLRIDKLLSSLGPGPLRILGTTISTYRQEASVVDADVNQKDWSDNLPLLLFLFYLLVMIVNLFSGRYSRGYVVAFFAAVLPISVAIVGVLVWWMRVSVELDAGAWIGFGVLVVLCAVGSIWSHRYLTRRFPKQTDTTDKESAPANGENDSIEGDVTDDE